MKPRPEFLTALVVFVSLSALCAQQPDEPLTPSQAKELRIWTGQLSDPNTSAKTKLDAAALLLDRAYPQATKALLDVLAAENAPEAKIAVAEALARAGGSRKEFIEPLMAMLTGKDEAIRASAAKALLTYKNHGVVERLMEVMRDPKRDRSVRLATMAILQRVLDKRVVGALVGLLEDKDPSISKAALETLPKLTNIYGYDRRQWRQWWRKNKDKPLSEWLGTWAENLAQQVRKLEADNAGLRTRLAKALEDLYAATPPDRREAMLVGLLQDPIADVKLVGTSIVLSAITSGEKVPPPVMAEVRKLLSDEELRVRSTAVSLVGVLADAEALTPLLEQLEVETDLEVRRGLLASLGKLQDPAALPAIIKNVASKEPAVAAAAAVAIERIAAKRELKGKTNGEAAEVILSRYDSAKKAGSSEEIIALREALLRAMGALGNEAFVPVVSEALKDDAAMIRLAAVGSLGELGDGSTAPAVVPLLGDQDRGVRQAAIVVLGKLGGEKYVQSIIERTRVSAEPDAAVRQQAKDVAIGILKEAETQTLWDVAGQMQNSGDGRQLQIEVLEMLVDRLETEKSKHLHAAHRQLGMALRQAGRHADAVGHLRRAFELLAENKSPQAAILWRDWLDALYEHDVQAAVNVIAEQSDETLFSTAYSDLTTRLRELKEAGQWSELLTLAEASVKQLAPRLTAEQLDALNRLVTEAKEQIRSAKEKEVRKLTAELLAGDEAARARAVAAIKSAGNGAVRPLLKELKDAVAAERPDPQAEKVLLAVLAEVAPQLELNAYDAASGPKARLKVIDEWLSSVE